MAWLIAASKWLITLSTVVVPKSYSATYFSYIGASNRRITKVAMLLFKLKLSQEYCKESDLTPFEEGWNEGIYHFESIHVDRTKLYHKS